MHTLLCGPLVKSSGALSPLRKTAEETKSADTCAPLKSTKTQMGDWKLQGLRATLAVLPVNTFQCEIPSPDLLR